MGALHVHRKRKISDYYILGQTLGKGSFAVVKEVRCIGSASSLLLLLKFLPDASCACLNPTS